MLTTQTAQQWQYKAPGKASTSQICSVGTFKRSTSFYQWSVCVFSFSRKFSSVMTRITQEPLTATRCAMLSMMQVLSLCSAQQLKKPCFVLVHHRVRSLNTHSVLPFKDRSQRNYKVFFTSTELLKYPTGKPCMSCQPNRSLQFLFNTMSDALLSLRISYSGSCYSGSAEDIYSHLSCGFYASV